MPKQTYSYASHRRKRTPIIAVTVGLLVVALVAWLLVAHWHHKPAANVNKSGSTGGQYTKGEGTTGGSGTNATGSTGSTDANGDKGQASGGSSGTIITPTGTFVSAHHISRNDNPAMQSTCQTSPGVSCRITFTNSDGTVLKLAAQTTDSGGATYWTWYPKDMGLMAGTWKVQAVAGPADNTVTADDALPLEVSP